MFGLDYKGLHNRIEKELKDGDVSVEMKRALLELELGLRKVEYVELKESIKEETEDETDWRH